MTKKVSDRLGCVEASGREQAIKVHNFFHQKIDWEALEHRRVEPPFKPNIVRLPIIPIVVLNHSNSYLHVYRTLSCVFAVPDSNSLNIRLLFPAQQHGTLSLWKFGTETDE